ncbi:MAG: protease inhibitor I9 family protein [Jiangellaceae bacterium]
MRRVRVLVKLDYRPLASYSGDLPGLAATSPSVTGHRLGGGSTAEQEYAEHIATIEREFRAALDAAVPEADIARSLRTVFGGVAAVIPANRVADVRALAHVVDVYPDQVGHQDPPDPTSTGRDTQTRRK